MEACRECLNWEFATYDDANERYGQCIFAYEGADEAYPWSSMLLAKYGPKDATDKVYTKLLTHEDFYCAEFDQIPLDK